jgi:hypothetical protein
VWLSSSCQWHTIETTYIAGAYIFDVSDCTEFCHDGRGIAEVLLEVGCNVVGGKEHASKFGGWTLDNTKANHSAMKELAGNEVSKKWINVGCIAHSLEFSHRTSV